LSWVCRYDCDGRTIKPLKNRQTPQKLTSSNTSVGTLAGLYRHGSFPNAFKEKKKKEKRTRTAIEAVSTGKEKRKRTEEKKIRTAIEAISTES
jgi:hypothetical protein